jgi:hypothetical protein
LRGVPFRVEVTDALATTIRLGAQTFTVAPRPAERGGVTVTRAGFPRSLVPPPPREFMTPPAADDEARRWATALVDETMALFASAR